MPQLRQHEGAALRDAKPAWEQAWDRWDTDRDDPAALADYRQARDAWVGVMLRDVIGWKDRYRTPVPVGTPADALVRSPDYTVTVRPGGALVHQDTTGALVLVTDPVDNLRDPLGDGWAFSPVDRMTELLRAAGVPIGVVTDGRWWAIVSAPLATGAQDVMPASGIFDAQTWIEAPGPRDALIELLRLVRLVGGKPEDRLTELFKDSVAAAEEITEALGTQVRRAVELLVQALSEAARYAIRHGKSDPLPADRDEVYSAAVTVLMRTVFLLFAEERGLLPQSGLFADNYSMSTQLDVLRDREAAESSEALDATFLTWHRLLATSNALYLGATFDDARIPPYGGSLFDPDRFGFLIARDDHGELTVAVSDRVMVEVLDAVQVAKLRGQPARRISFRDIDVEQIGYIYEGLLGYSCADVSEVTVGLPGKEGEEPEIPLAALEALTAASRTSAGLSESKLAAAIIAWAKQDQPAATPPSAAALAKAIRDSDKIEDSERVLRAVTPHETLRTRLRPFVGIIRRDLRSRLTVMLPGGLIVVETPSRATAGAHYTPKPLAEEVVRYALEPLVYDPGPHQQVDHWVPVSSDQILELKVADIACGSGAFLVAAARFLADRLTEAWEREGAAVGTPGELRLHAIRTVVATCLYGADINAMAVEMCKLSLWLVSLDKDLPFSFVDDKVFHGNSLLGLTDVEQLKRGHITPDAPGVKATLFDVDVDRVLRRARQLRRSLATEVDDSDPRRSSVTKRRQWDEYQQLTEPLAEIADAIVATGLRLGGKPGKALNDAYQHLAIAVNDARHVAGTEPNRTMLENILEAGLTPTVSTDYRRWKPLHWILAVPDVMERGGFDAIVGNPPFLGDTKISGAMGANVRDWCANVLAGGMRGKADLVAYFFLQDKSLLNNQGNIGLIATNSIGQGDTRQVGLRQMVRHGLTITRSIQSASWPSNSVNLEYSAVWGSMGQVAEEVPRFADGIPALRISSLLESGEDIDPVRLAENTGIVFEGCKPYGMGFIIEPEEAKSWIDVNPKNRDVLFPYLNGEDLNGRPDTFASRFIIDYRNRPEAEAETYELPYKRLAATVKVERSRKSKPVREAPWWLFWRERLAMRQKLADRKLDNVIALARVSRTVMPVRVEADMVPGEAIVVFVSNSYADQAVLSSSLHQIWAFRYGSGMRSDPRYTPSTVFETFARPAPTGRLTEIGRILDTERREIMLRRDLGLTKLYNLVNDPATPDAADKDIARLREIHVELDRAVMAAYGWDDVELDHGFHTYRQMTRWTVSPAARVEILDRLLEENHRRAAAQGEAPPPADEEEAGDDE
jgi:hypothetical protein